MTEFIEEKKEKTLFDYLKIALIVFMVLVIIIVPISCFIPNSPTLRWILQALEWLHRQPLWLKGTLMVLILGFGIPIGGPATILELCAGFIFGFWVGSLFAALGMTLGAIICFFWGKYLLIEWAEKQQREKKLVRAICFAVRKEALKLVVLCRLSPVLPTFMMNYLFATTGMSFGIYILGSVLGDFPWVFCYCYIGSMSKSLADAFNDTGGSKTAQIALLVVGIVGTILLLIIVTYIGKREIKKAMEEMDAQEEEAEYKPLSVHDHKSYTSTATSAPLIDDTSSSKAGFELSSNHNEKELEGDSVSLNHPPNPYLQSSVPLSPFSQPAPFAQSAPLQSTISPPFASSQPISAPSDSPFSQSSPLPSAPFANSMPFPSVAPSDSSSDQQSHNAV